MNLFFKRQMNKQDVVNSFFTKRPAVTSPVALKKQKIQVEIQSETIVEVRDEEKENGNSQLFSCLAKVLEKVENTTKRLEIQDIFSRHLSKIFSESPKDVLPTVYLSSARIAPDYKGIELGIGDGLLSKAIAQAFGKQISSIKREMETIGDLAKVAESSRQNQKTMFKPKPLTIQRLFEVLKEIAVSEGKSSQQRKVDKICGLLGSAENIECRYLIRILSGKMRIGLSEQTMLHCVSRAAAEFWNFKDLKEAENILKAVYCEVPSFDAIIPELLKSSIECLPANCKLLPGIPVKPMLAQASKSIDDVLKRFENKVFTCEFKYDGERAQLHKAENGISYVYSRNSENLSEKYPDLLQLISQVSNSTSYILDCEAVAYDPIKKTILPFQELQKRKRKGVTTGNITIPVIVYPFDLLYLNGQSLLQQSFAERRELLKKNFKVIPEKFEFASYQNCNDVEQITEYLDASIDAKCEGLMLKTLEGKESSYEPSKRSLNWFKLKKDYLDSTGGDTLDLVVIGAYYGKGKRTGAFGGYLLATWDAEAEEFQSVCKLGTGFKDNMLEKLTQEFKPLVISGPKPFYNCELKPDVWLEAVKVFEIQAADFTLSPVHSAAARLMEQNKGISLRFPRFIRERDDKTPENCTSPHQLVDLYESQAAMKKE
eukprot:NODE_381_length_8377_cov_0.385238.p1 type:complete len:657 gc:universal NODE_381_length_8377_cov_0.385238:3506-5476(+)